MKKNILAQNDEGFALVLCLLILMVLTVSGLTATQTATVELRIAGNERAIRNNLFQAEGVTSEGGQCIDSQETVADLRMMGNWLDRVPSDEITPEQQAEIDALEEGVIEEWLDELLIASGNPTCFTINSGLDDGSQTIAKKGYNLGVPQGGDSGSSLKMTGGSTMYSFQIIGLSSQEVGVKTVEVGFRKRLSTSES